MKPTQVAVPGSALQPCNLVIERVDAPTLPRHCCALGCHACIRPTSFGVRALGNGVAESVPTPISFGDGIARIAVVDGGDLETRQIMRNALTADLFADCEFFNTAAAALQTLSDFTIKLSIVELALPDACGIECALQLLARQPSMKVILVTNWQDSQIVEFAFAAGIAECLVKPIHVGQCLATLMAAGFKTRAACSMHIPGHLANRRSPGSIAVSTFAAGSREEQILSCLEDGLLYKEIQDRLHISLASLKKLQHRIFLRLGSHNRTEAVKEWRLRNSQLYAKQA